MSNSDDSIREKSIQALSDSIKPSPSSSSASASISDIAKDLESAIFQSHDSQTHNPYRQNVRTIILALKQNQQLVKSLVSGEISAQQVAVMDDEQLKTQARAAEDSELRSQGLQNSLGLPDSHEQVGPPLNTGADNIAGAEPDPLVGVEQDMDDEKNNG